MKSKLYINSDDFVLEIKKLENKIHKLDLSSMHRLEVLYELDQFEVELLNKLECKNEKASR